MEKPHEPEAGGATAAAQTLFEAGGAQEGSERIIRETSARASRQSQDKQRSIRAEKQPSREQAHAGTDAQSVDHFQSLQQSSTQLQAQDQSIFANPKLNQLNHKQGKLLKPKRIDGHLDQTANTETLATKMQFAVNQRNYNEFNEVQNSRYNKNAPQTRRLLNNRIGILSPTNYQTLNQTMSPKVHLEREFQVLGKSAMNTNNSGSGTNAQTFIHIRPKLKGMHAEVGQVNSNEDLHDGFQAFNSKYDQGDESSKKKSGSSQVKKSTTQALRYSQEKPRSQNQRSRRDQPKTQHGKRNDQIFVFNSQDVTSKLADQTGKQRMMVGQVNQGTTANSGAYHLSTTLSGRNSQFPSSRYDNMNVNHQFKLVKELDEVGTHRDFRNRKELLTDKELEKICFLSGVDSFRTESEINHVLHRSQIQSQDLNRVFSPQLSQPGHQEVQSPMSRTQNRTKIKSINGGPRQAIKMPKFLAQHMVEKRIFTQQFMNTQRNEEVPFAPNIDDEVNFSQQRWKKQEGGRQLKLKKQIDNLGSPDVESSWITNKQKSSTRRSPVRGSLQVKKESKSLNLTPFGSQPENFNMKKKTSPAKKEVARPILTNSINFGDQRREDRRRDSPKGESDTSKLRNSVQQEGSFHVEDLLHSTGSKRGQSVAGSNQRFDGGMSGMSSNPMNEKVISINYIQDVISACESHNQIKNEIMQMPDYGHKSFFKLEADEEFAIKNYRLFKRKIEQGNQDEQPRGRTAVTPVHVPGHENYNGEDDVIDKTNITIGEKTTAAEGQLVPTWSKKVKMSNSIINANPDNNAAKMERASRLNWDQVASLPIKAVNHRNFINTLDGLQEESLQQDDIISSRVIIQGLEDPLPLHIVMEDDDQPDDQAVAQISAVKVSVLTASNPSVEDQASSRLAASSFRNRAREEFTKYLDVWLEGTGGVNASLQGILSESFLSESYFDSKPKGGSSASFEKTSFNKAGKAKAAWKKALLQDKVTQQRSTSGELRKSQEAPVADESDRTDRPSSKTPSLAQKLEVLNAQQYALNNQTSTDTERNLAEESSLRNTSRAPTKEENNTALPTAMETMAASSTDGQEAQQPYDCLKARVVHKEQSLLYQVKMKKLESITDKFERLPKMIELNKTFLTALDKRRGITELMPFELFIEDYQNEVQWISQQINMRKQQALSPLKANSFFYHLDGRVEKMVVDVLAYDESIAKFFVEYEIPMSSPTRRSNGNNAIKKQSGRLNLQFLDFETEEQVNKRFMDAQNRRKVALMLLAEERMILNELVYQYQDLKMPMPMKMKMRKLVNDRINLKSYPQQEIVQDLIMQVEAGYVYYILKSTIRSQIEDPLIQSYMKKQELKTLEAPAVDNAGTMFKKYEMPKYSIERRQDFHNSICMIKSDTVPGNKDLISIIKTVMDQTHFVMRSNPLFELPSKLKDETIGYMLSQKAFARNTKESLRAKLSQFPVSISYIHEVQNCLATRFKSHLHNKWLELIVQKTENVIKSEFAGGAIVNESSKSEKKKIVTSKSQIKPFLIKFFTCINIYMERMLFDKMKTSMEKFLKFLLQFMARQSGFNQRSAFQELGLNVVTYSCEKSPMSKIKVQVQRRSVDLKIRIQESEASRNSGSTQRQPSDAEDRYEVATVPDINESWKMLEDIMKKFQEALSGVKKIENIIFPLLIGAKPYLEEPNAEKIDDLKVLDGRIKWLLSQAQAQPMAIIKDISKYLKHVSITESEMIRSMKIQILNKKMIHREAKLEEVVREAPQDRGIEELLLQKSDSSLSEPHTPPKSQRKDTPQPEQELRPEEQFEQALEQLEITQEEYSGKLFELTTAYWEIQEKYQNQYDFGIILLDLAPVKKQISTKIDSLIKKLQARAVQSFTTKMDELDKNFLFIENKLTAAHYTIDDVLEQIDYIKMMFKNSDIIEDLEVQLDILKNKKNFLDEESIKLPSEGFMRYLNLFLQPHNLRDLIDDKFSNLNQQKRKITEMLQADVDELNAIIMTCKYQVDDFQKRGLQTPAELEKMKRKKDLPKDLLTALSAAQKQKEPVVVDKDLIKQNVDQLGKLDHSSNEIFLNIDTLGKRQKQLGQKVSTFPKMQTVSKELSPFKQMWDIAYKYSVKRTAWWFGKLSAVQSQQLQDCINSWHKALSSLKTFSNLNQYEKPGTMLNFIFKEIDDIKSYLPIVQRLRAKGLEKRHFVEMSNLLGVNVDPAYLTMTDIKLKKLYMGETLEAIKNVSGVAFKENSIRMAIDAIEREIREICFECLPYKDQPVKVIKNCDAVLLNLDESLIKLQAIKGNEFAKFQADRIIKIEREIKFLQNNFESWTRVQKAWIYLETIYTQDDVAENLPEQKRIFDDVNFKFRKIMNANTVQFTMIQDFCRSEGFTTTAVKMIEDLEHLDKSLTDYLDKKRMQFARLYFTSNDELIGLMGNIQNQQYVQVFLSKLFEGIAGLIFGDQEIRGFFSKSNEQLFFKRPISTLVPPELWLKEIETGMKTTLYQLLHAGLKDYSLCQRDGERALAARREEQDLVAAGLEENMEPKRDHLNIDPARIDRERLAAEQLLVAGRGMAENTRLNAAERAEERGDAEEDEEIHEEHKTAGWQGGGRISDWLLRWPGQVLILAMQIMHTNSMETLFKQRQTKRNQQENAKPVNWEKEVTIKSIYQEVLDQLEEASQMINRKLDNNARFSIHNFVINRIHTRDSIQEMLKDEEKDSDENFYWKIQMKYHYAIHKVETTKPPAAKSVENKQPATGANNESWDEEGENNQKQFQVWIPEPWDFSTNAEYDWLPEQEYQKQGVKELTVSCLMARKQFGYEYLGNQNRLVITPLTDRCFRTMFMALHYGYGSQLEGPVGTGKTETTKELAKCLGRICFVFTCSQSLNYESLIKFFKGFASGGSWACFDELNRIDLNVLSILSTTVLTINQAQRERKQEIFFADDEKSVKFNPSCAIFFTQNPATQRTAGRNELPGSLKNQFRPIQMAKPDLAMITEVILYCNGFTNSDGLALKLVQMFEFAKRQLGDKAHYDFSLRNIKSILDQAGHLRQLVTGMKDPDTHDELQKADQQLEQHLVELECVQQELRRQHEKQNDMYMGKTKPRESRLSSGQSRRSSISRKSAVDQNKTFEQKPAQENAAFKEEDDGMRNESASKSQYAARITTNERNDTQRLSVLLSEIASNSAKSEEHITPEDIEDRELFERCKKWLGVTEYGVISNIKKLEKYILLKAIFDQNLSKLEENDKIVFKGITKDIFKPAKVEIQPNARLKEDILSTMKFHGLQPEPDYVTSVLNLNEIINTRHGIMLIGSTMVGKTNALKLIEDTYNMQQKQELHQKKAEFLKRRAKIMAEGRKKSSSIELGLISTETAEQKEQSSNALSQEELQMLKATCKSKGVNKFIINPKAQPYIKLNGETDLETKEFKEGIISTTMRAAMKQRQDKFQWIIFDGDIEIQWVENLNSVLDDNKKLTLVTGESLPLTEYSRMIFESNNLQHCSPASISRCGMIYLCDKLINYKSIVNHYMRNFPKFLSDLVYQFDQMANYFLPGILEHFLCEDNQHNMIYPVTPKHAIMNFLQYFEACIADYRHEKFSDWKTVQRLQEQVAEKKDQNVDGIPESNIQKARSLKSRQKISYFRFAENDARMTNAIKFRERWLECFFIQSLIWAFGTILKENHRKEFIKFITKSILKNFDDSIEEAEEANKDKIPELEARMRKAAEEAGGGSREPSAAGEPTQETAVLVIDHDKFEQLIEGGDSYEPSPHFVLKNQPDIVQEERSEKEDQEEEGDVEEEDELMKLIEDGQLEDMKMQQSSRQTSEKLLKKQNTEVQAAAQPEKQIQSSCDKSSTQLEGQFSHKVKTFDDQSYAPQKMLINSNSEEGKERQKLVEPTFKCGFPESNIKSIFDMYFDIDICRWQTFEDMFKLHAGITDKDGAHEEQALHTVETKTNLFTAFIQTVETTQLSYFIENNLTFHNNIALVGESGTGKSWLLNQVVSRYANKFPEEYIIAPMVFYHRTSTANILKTFELPLERKRKNLYIPQDGKKLVYMIDDLNMCNQGHRARDEKVPQASCVLELLRQYFDHRQWYDLATLERKTIEDVSFAACITYNNSNIPSSSRRSQDSSSGSQLLGSRNQRHWAFLGVPCNNQHLKTIFTTIAGEFIDSWPTLYDEPYSQKLIDCVLELRTSYHKLIRTSTNKVLLAFNVRQLFRIIHSFVLFTPEKNYKQTELDVYKLLISESFRTLIDRVQEKDDRYIFNIEINALAQKFFTLEKEEQETLQKQVGKPYFSYLNTSPVVADGEYRYQEVDNVRMLKPMMEDFVAEYNEAFKHSQLNVSMFDHAMEQVIKMNRAIQQPFSNVILIGVEGLGKMALARLTIYICQYQMRELKLTAVFDREDWYGMLKDMFESAVMDKRVNVLNIQDNQIADDIIMVDLNCLLKNGELPDLLHSSEKSGFLERIRSTMPQSKLAGTAPPDSQVYNEMINRSRRNFKSIINLTPTGRILKKELKNYQSIMNCSTIIWMDQWPEEGYKQVGKMRLTHYFTDEDDDINEVKVTQEDEIVRCALKMHMDMQKAIKEYTKETGHFIYLTPCTFTNLIQTFKDFLRSRVSHFTALKRKFQAGLDKLDATERKVFDIQEDMDVKSPELVEKQRRIEDILRELDDSTQEMEARIKFVEEEEMALKATQEDAQNVRDQCGKALQEAMPRLKEAIHSLRKLTKSELTELKSIKRPSAPVYILMQCVCILLGVPPKRVKHKTALNKHEDDWWGAAIGKEVLGNHRLVDILSNFNPERLDQDIMKQLDVLSSNKEFTLLNITKACEAAKGIFHWLKSIENYYYIYEECKPKRDALMLAEKQILVHQDEIKHRMGALKTLQDKLSELRDEYKDKEKDVKQLQEEIDTCGLQKTRAAKLLSALAGEKQKWYVLTNVVKKKFETLQGDCLLAAALMIYLGQFTHQYREDYVNRWFHMIRHKSSMKISEYFDFIKLFGDKVKIQKWILNRLPSDTFSINNALMIEMNTQIQSIIIDPQWQANIWLKQNSREDDSLLTVSFRNPKFLQLISASIKFGKKALCENVGQDIDKALYPLFNKSMLKVEGKSQFIKLQGTSEEIDANFKLYVTTEYQSPIFQSEIAVYTNFINFTITKEGLEAQLLSVIVIEKLYTIEREFIDLKTQALDCIIRLDSVEELILQALDNEILAVLNDESLIENLTQSSYTSKKIQTSLQQINRSQNALEANRSKFQVVAKRAALLYFLVRDLQRIEHIYQFSLKWFLELFDFELKTKENLNTTIDPLLDLNQRLTKSVYQKICVGLYQKDKLVVAFLLGIALLRREVKFDENHLKFIIKGPFATETPKEQMTQVEKDELELRKKISYSNPQKAKIMRHWHGWMTNKHWEGLEALAKIAPFNKPNIIDLMIKNPHEWHSFIQSQEENPNGIIPGPYGRFTTSEEKEAMRLKNAREAQMLKQQRSFIKEEEAKNVNIEDILAADNSDSDDQLGVVKETQFGAINQRKTQTPPLTDHSDEEEDAFLKRRNYVQEDEYVGTNIIHGLPEYNEFKIGEGEEVDREQEHLQFQINRDILKFCLLRIFRPDLIIELVKRIIEDVLDETFTDQEPFNFLNVLKHTDNKRATLMIVDSSMDAQQELLRMKVETKQSMPLTYKALTVKNITKLPEILTDAAQQGHWVLLDGLHLVTQYVPAIMQFLENMFFFHEDQKEKRQRDLRRKRSRIKAVESTTQADFAAKKVFQDIEFGQATAEEGPAKKSTATEALEVNLQMPQIDGFKIDPGFRLWISTKAKASLPISMLQECNKIICEPMQGLKQNLSKIISSTPDEIEQACPAFSEQYKRLFFVISFYHAIMNERKRFQALGWNRIYEFSQVDYQLSQYAVISILSDLERLDAEQVHFEFLENDNASIRKDLADRVPQALSLIKYIISGINYGGKISNDQDHLIAQELLNTLINAKTISKYPANLTGLAHLPECLRQYVLPEARGNKETFVNHICRFPSVDRPEVFGIHFNAQRAQTEAEGLDLLAQVFAFDQTKTDKLYNTKNSDVTIDETDPDKLQRYKTKLKDVTFYTPKDINKDKLDLKFKISYENSIAILMHQEVQKYNNLLGFIKSSMAALFKYLNGDIILDQAMEEELYGIINDKTPARWLSVSYPGSSVLPTYLHNLQRRIDYINSILNEDLEQNQEMFKFWLPGLFDTGNFFTMMLQHEARRRGLQLETMTFKYTTTTIYDDAHDPGIKATDRVRIEEKLTRPPDGGGYYIYGVSISSGSWSKKMKFMEDIPSNQRGLCEMFPAIHLQIIQDSESQLYIDVGPGLNNLKAAVKRPTPTTKVKQELRKLNLNTDRLTKCWNLYDVKNNKYYLTPLYVTTERDMLSTTTAASGFIGYVPIRIDNTTDAAFWVRRNVALVCHID